MKIKLMIIGLIVLLIAVILCGCNNQSNGGLHGNDQDFIGTWKTGGGSFAMGDSIRFNSDYTCDFFWSHNSNILLNGTWDRTYKNQVGYVVVISLGDIETIENNIHTLVKQIDHYDVMKKNWIDIKNKYPYN